MPVITLTDFLILPVYLLLLFFLANKASNIYKFNTPQLRRYFFIAFFLHIIGSVLFALLLQYYYKIGDSLEYYNGGELLSDMYRKDITNLKYLFSPAENVRYAIEKAGYGDRIPVNIVGDPNLAIMKVSSIISLFSFGRYIEINLFFGFLAFLGNWNLFYVLNKLNNGNNQTILAFSVLFIPSIWFWSSGLGKEGICMFALGTSIILFYKMYIKKEVRILYLLSATLIIYLMTLVKEYITVTLFLSVVLTAIFMGIKLIKGKSLRVAVLCIGLPVLIFIISISPIPSLIQDAAEESFNQIDFYQEIYQQQGELNNSQSTFLLDTNLTPQSLVVKTPAVIFTCLFRPYPWESGKIIMLFSSLEATLTFIFTLFVLWKTRVWGFFENIFNNPIGLFCFIFSILFAALVGFTTFNFGTMVRYKIIFLPFYYFLLTFIYTRYTTANPTKHSWKFALKKTDNLLNV
jgi:hypothetical protein